MNPFSDPQAVARYAEAPPRLVPGLDALHRMTTLLLAEHAPREARILVLGAGGGLDLTAFAKAQPEWSFDGVDPSAEMLTLAMRTLGPLASRVQFHQGYIDDAPPGPFDAATCLLTLHFMPPDERRRAVAGVRRRLKPGSPFVVAHHSIPSLDAERVLWLSRFAAFAVASGADPQAMAAAREGMRSRLPILAPEEDEAILREAGFSNVGLFYAAFTFRGWVAYT